jgi:hypothetical protein
MQIHGPLPFDTHVCLVSEQALPNLTPALDSGWRPQRVVLVVSDDQMDLRAGWLATLLSRHGIRSEIFRLSSVVDFDLMLSDFRRVVEAFPRSTLNATGGKKTMSLAAFSAFREKNRPVFYVERDNRIHWLTPQFSEGAELSTELSLHELLYAYGQSVDEAHTEPVPLDELGLAEQFFQQPQRCVDPLVSLSFKGEGEEKSIVSKYPGAALSSSQKKLLETIRSSGLVQKTSRGWVCGKAEAAFLTGGWLEAYVFSVVRELKGPRDVCRGLKLRAMQSADTGTPPVKNEIDVAFLQENRLFIIECKALKPATRTKSVADFLYTLESVRKNGGLTAKAALLTWGAEPGEGDKARANDNRIRVFAGSSLSQIRIALQTWVQSASD